MQAVRPGLQLTAICNYRGPFHLSGFVIYKRLSIMVDVIQNDALCSWLLTSLGKEAFIILPLMS